MRIYIASLIVGVLVGVIYSVVNVRSPAPPAWALVGLLGMLMGEQLIPYVKQHVFSDSTQSQSAEVQQKQQTTTQSDDN